jgi:flagellin-like hook-associated protein FlgL
MSGINLTSAMRSNLLTLQGTQTLIGATQNRLATGLKVSSAIDDPRNFFQAQGLNNRANDLNRRLDGMGLAIKTFEAADKGIKAMTKIVENMSAIVKEAKDATGDTPDLTRETLRQQYEKLREQLQDVAKDSGFNGINLLAGDTLSVAFNESGDSKLERIGVDYTDSELDPGLNLAAQAATDWDTVAAPGEDPLVAVEAALTTAIGTLRTQAATFGSDLTLVRIREDFTKEMVNTLKAGADGLVLADQNEEAANLLALQTSQQLGIQALSLAAQSQQGILRLF